jgi:hypothetical protein
MTGSGGNHDLTSLSENVVLVGVQTPDTFVQNRVALGLDRRLGLASVELVMYNTDVYIGDDETMVRTQIYLTNAERKRLAAVARSTGKKQSELIREAVDRFLDLNEGSYRTAVIDDVAGIWRDRVDLPDFAVARRSWDRG